MAFDGGFTPRQFPIDPFDAEKPSRLPWSLDASSLPDGILLAKRINVLVVLGEPPLDAIAPLLHSPNLAASLVILATSRAYSIPLHTSPAVRILRLGVPLASSDSAASRLASVLQWADRIATQWRASARPPAFEELPEETVTAGYQTPPQRTSWFGSGSSSALPSPASSDLALSLSRKSTPPKRSATSPDLPPSLPTQRAFDALFDFLPPDAPDRHLLKHAILVTTLARPFLASSAQALAPLPQQRTPSRRFSIRGRPAPAPPPATPVVGQTHIIHLIPPKRAALVRPLESFCLSFSFPVRGSLDAPRPYVMPPAALSDILHAQMRPWSLAELVLCGALDGENDNATVSLRSLAKTNRAWITGVSDIVLTAGSKRLPYTLPHSGGTRPPSVMLQPQPRVARPRHPQPFFVQPDDAEIGVLPRPVSQQFPAHGHAPPRIPMRDPRRASMSMPAVPAAAFHTSPRRSAPGRPSVTLPVRTGSMSSPTRTAFPARAERGKDPASRAVTSVWPTPPPSAASSPSSSPELRGEAEVRVENEVVVERGKSGKESKVEVPPWDGSLRKRKLRGLLAWIKR